MSVIFNISHIKLFLQTPSLNKTLMESLQNWSMPFEELDPLLRFEKMNLVEASFNKLQFHLKDIFKLITFLGIIGCRYM